MLHCCTVVVGAVVERDVDEDVDVLEDVDDVEMEVEVDVLVEVEVLEEVDEVEVDVLVEVEVLEEVDEVEVDVLVEVEVLGAVEVDAMLVVLVVDVPPFTIPAWTTNGNITIAKTARLNTIPILLIDISAPLLVLNGTVKILKRCCYAGVGQTTKGR